MDLLISFRQCCAKYQQKPHMLDLKRVFLSKISGGRSDQTCHKANDTTGT